jgi:hypothetical protein
MKIKVIYSNQFTVIFTTSKPYVPRVGDTIDIGKDYTITGVVYKWLPGVDCDVVLYVKRVQRVHE